LNAPEFKTEAKRLLHLAAPLVAGQLASIGMMFTDTVMAGRLSALTLSGVALGGSVFSPMILLAVGTLLVVSPFVAQYNGAGERERVARMVHQGLYLALALGAGVVLVCFNASPLMRALEVDAAIIPVAAEYLRYVSFGAIGLCLYSVQRFTSEGLSLTRPTLGFALFGMLLNIPLNYALMYGAWGFPQMGAAGCGLATTMVFFSNAIGMGLYLHHRRHYRDLGVYRHWHSPDPAILKRLLVVGLPLGFSLFLEGTLFSAVTMFVGKYGETVVAANQIGLSVTHMVFMVPLGIGLAVTVRVGTELGRQDLEAMVRAAKTGMAVVFLIQIVIALALVVGREAIVGVYSDNPEVLTLAASLLVIAAIYQIPDGMQMVSSGALRGLKDTRRPMLMLILAYWGAGIPSGYLMGTVLEMGVRGYWLGLIVGLSVAAVCLFTRFHYLTGQMRRGERPLGPIDDAMPGPAGPGNDKRMTRR
jgi:MATE family multidrug resistance protein